MENTSGFKTPAVSGTQPWGWSVLLLLGGQLLESARQQASSR
jgi:hypothetical protein